jgi:archaellum component FlaC
MKMLGENGKEMSHAFLRQQSGIGRGVYLNDTLNEQKFFIELDIHDSKGGLVCSASMSYEQFVRLLLFSGEVPITLTQYRDSNGNLAKEEVEKPKSAADTLLNDLSDSIGGVQDRITDMRKDLYELLNSGKTVGKKKLEELLSQIKTIESHYNSNIPFVTKEAANRVGEIQDNAMSQISIAVNQMIGSNMKPEDFKDMICGDSIMALPDHTVKPIEDDYELEEREVKPVDEMSNLELADTIHKYLRAIERAENKYIEANPIENKDDEYGSRKLLYTANATEAKGGVSILYISYHTSHIIKTERAREYLKFLMGIKKYTEFKTDYWFDKE